MTEDWWASFGDMITFWKLLHDVEHERVFKNLEVMQKIETLIEAKPVVPDWALSDYKEIERRLAQANILDIKKKHESAKADRDKFPSGHICYIALDALVSAYAQVLRESGELDQEIISNEIVMDFEEF